MEKKRQLRWAIGAGLAVALLVGVIEAGRGQQVLPELSFLKSREILHVGRNRTAGNGAATVETIVNVPLSFDDVVKRIQSEMPQTVRRFAPNGVVCFVVPQKEQGRIKITEMPNQAIYVRSGRMVKQPNGRLTQETSDKWTCLDIRDFRRPSAIETAFNWLNDTLGI